MGWASVLKGANHIPPLGYSTHPYPLALYIQTCFCLTQPNCLAFHYKVIHFPPPRGNQHHVQMLHPDAIKLGPLFSIHHPQGTVLH